VIVEEVPLAKLVTRIVSANDLFDRQVCSLDEVEDGTRLTIDIRYSVDPRPDIAAVQAREFNEGVQKYLSRIADVIRDGWQPTAQPSDGDRD
jgi:hypothetical protein